MPDWPNIKNIGRHFHHSGQILDAPNDPVEFGGEQTIRLLGPFHVAHDDVGLDATAGDPTELGAGAFLQLDAVPDGAIILSTWVEITENFPIASTLQVCVQPDDDPDNSSGLGLWSARQSVTPVDYAFNERTDSTIAAARAITGTFLSVRYVGDAAAAGEADIYALIAEPA